MSPTIKLVLAALLAVVIALGAGWIWGRSGISELRERADSAEVRLRECTDSAELRLTLSEALAATRAGRIELFTVNFGSASGEFERAKTALRRALQPLQANNRTEAAAQVTSALRLLEEAQQFANKLDQTANARAADAATAIEAAASKMQ
jgi:hypothetical protein